MSVPTASTPPPKTLTVALVGNPNTGKSTLFNALSGLRQHVGNYPGVTVEMKKGRTTAGELSFDLIDLPGTYSLAARSPDEMVAVDLLLGRRPEEPRPDVIVSIVDASNLDRHLYLTSQLFDLGVPVVLAVNMVDVAKTQGIEIDFAALSERLGVPVVPVQANKGMGLDTLKKAIIAAAESREIPRGPSMPVEFEKELATLQNEVNGELPGVLTRRLLLDVGGYVERFTIEHHGSGLKPKLDAARGRLSDLNHGVPGVETRARFAWIRPIVAAAVRKPAVRPITTTDRLDKILTHRVAGTLIFLAIMFLVFQSIFLWAEPLMGAIDEATGWLAGHVRDAMSPGPLRSLLADGIIAGVGGVIKFLPQILILFGFIAVLEDCGYMARAAFLMDKLMSRCGLSGKSFIPMLSSVACAVPGIMATRVIEQRRDRLATMLVAPLMSCSARLPVYALLIGTFLTAGYPWWMPGFTLFAMYMIGFTIAPFVALLLKRTLLRGETPMFLMELPAYKRPTIRGVIRRMADAGWAFLRRAGTVILASMILIWALLYFPNMDARGFAYEPRLEEAEKAVAEAEEAIKPYKNEKKEIPAEVQQTFDTAEKWKNDLTAEWKSHSLLGQLGHKMEPVFAPLGWDWKIGMAALASFPAREVVVGTLGIIYSQGEVKEDEQRQQLGEKIREDWKESPVRSRYGVVVALSIMVFFALCMQCASTLAVIRRETKSWSWPAFTFAYMTVLAYVAALLTFQVGKLITNALA